MADADFTLLWQREVCDTDGPVANRDAVDGALCICWCKHGDSIFNFWSPSICYSSTLFVHMKGDEAQSSRTSNSALITVISSLSGCHKQQCCLAPWQAQRRVDAHPPVGHQSPVSAATAFGLIFIVWNPTVMTLPTSMKGGESLSGRVCGSEDRSFCTKSQCWAHSWNVTGDVVITGSDNAVIIFELL